MAENPQRSILAPNCVRCGHPTFPAEISCKHCGEIAEGLIWFLENARDVVQAYDMLEASASAKKRIAGYRFLEIFERIIPQPPFDDESQYPDNELFVGEVPPAVAGIRSATTHYAVYRLARETLGKILVVVKEIIPDLPDNVGRDRWGGTLADYRKLPAELRTILRTVFQDRVNARLAANICTKLSLVPIDVEVVLQRLEVEYVRAEHTLKQRVPYAASHGQRLGREPWQRVVLRGRTEGPIVLARKKRILTSAQYDVVDALLGAGDAGLTKDELVTRSKHEDARGILNRLAASDADWREVIYFAERTGGRYRIK